MPITQIHPTEVTRTPDNIITWSIEWLWEVRNVPYGIPTNIFTTLRENMLEKNTSFSPFDNQRNILSWFYLDYVCIEYTDAQIRESDKVNNQNHYELINMFQSKPQDENGRQIAKNVGEFDCNGKYYLMISPRNTPLPDETIPDRGIFKWIIVDMGRYDSTKTWEEVLVQHMKDAVKGIVQQ